MIKKISYIIAFLFFIFNANIAQANFYYDSNIFEPEEIEGVKPFGHNLFSGEFIKDKSTGVNEEYIIQPGDNITLSSWGEFDESKIVTVDSQGNIFIPKVGPVKVAGLKNSELNNEVNSQVKEVFPSGIEVYTDLVGANQVSIFVTGSVKKPGSYNGAATDSILHYIDKASGILEATGSYRNVQVKRKGAVIEQFDIYDFLIYGSIPQVQLRDGDVIIVNQRGLSVSVDGEAKNKNLFEFSGSQAIGADLIKLAQLNSGVTNVSISGFRDREPISKYMTLNEFKNFQIAEGDNIIFHSTAPSEKIKVSIEGEHLGPSVVVAPKDSGLIEILSQVKINPELSNYKAVRIERREVAIQQKISLENSLRRLEETTFATQTAAKEELAYKALEAQLIAGFIANARKAKPRGTIVVATDGLIKDIKLKDGDKIIIPAITNVVMVSGEVSAPSAIVFDESLTYKSYISKAGGLTSRADSDNIIVVKASGESVPANKTNISQGDEIIVLPEIKVDSLSLASKIMDVIYKLVLSVALPIKLIDN